MASMKDIKRRRVSIQSTQQITKAMKLVSTVKLQRARARAERSKTYFEAVCDTVSSMFSKTGSMEHPYLKQGEAGKIGIVVITSNRGLAGGYNSNIVKLIRESGFSKEDVKIYAIGKKGMELLAFRGYEIAKDYSEMAENPVYREASLVAKELLEDFATGQLREIHLAYTVFRNTVSHVPTMLQLLPIVPKEEQEEKAQGTEKDYDALTLMNFEPSLEEALELLVPNYFSSVVYGALVEAAASENGARMQAMDNATENAQEMIDHLELSYNRARQGTITQELTEIVAGVDALSG